MQLSSEYTNTNCESSFFLPWVLTNKLRYIYFVVVIIIFDSIHWMLCMNYCFLLAVFVQNVFFFFLLQIILNNCIFHMHYTRTRICLSADTWNYLLIFSSRFAHLFLLLWCRSDYFLQNLKATMQIDRFFKIHFTILRMKLSNPILMLFTSSHTHAHHAKHFRKVLHFAQVKFKQSKSNHFTCKTVNFITSKSKRRKKKFCFRFLSNS